MKKGLIKVSISDYRIVLDTIKEFDGWIWITKFISLLAWSKEKQIINSLLGKSIYYWELENYERWLIRVIIEALIKNKFVFRNDREYPTISLMELWKNSLYEKQYIKEKETDLQKYIYMNYKPPLGEQNYNKTL